MLTRRSTLLTGSIAAVAGVMCPAGASPSPHAMHRVDLEVSDYPLLFMSIEVNRLPVRALLDTGNVSALRLSTRLVKQLGLDLYTDPTRQIRGLDNRPQPLQQARLESLAIGPWNDTNVTADVVADRIESVASQVGTAFDAILGWRFLSRWNFSLDYRRKVMIFSANPVPAADSAVSLSWEETGGLPIVTGGIDNQRIKFLLDTGAPSCNIDTSLAPGLPTGALIEREVQLAGSRFSVNWRVKDLSAIRTALGTLGVIGNNLLARQTLQLDVSRRILSLG